MTNYAATGNPGNGTRNISEQIRDEFLLIQNAISSKAERNANNSISTTSLTIGTGVKTLAIEPGKELVGGQTVSIADTASPAVNYMIGILLSYDSTTGLAQVDVTSFGGSGTKTSWIIGLSNPAGVTLGSNTFTGAQNLSRATVASHATTADIWNASGNQINFTGTATVTTFPSSPQPGASRELICTSACSFTAGSNMLIDGIDSGSTVTCAANDIVTVRAISVTQFHLTRQRYDGRPQKEVGNNVVTVHTGNGHGSINTKIRRYTTVLENLGSVITYADSATLGASFTVNEPGLYEVFMAERGSSAGDAGASLSSAELTTDIGSINIATRIFVISYNAGAIPITRTIRCVAGDVIRPHTNASFNIGTTSASMFSVRKIAHV